MSVSDHSAGDSPQPRRIRASDKDRDAVLTVLSEAHAAGRLTPVELDERQDSAMRASFLHELPELIDDLPEGEELADRLRSETEIVKPGGASSAVQRQRRIPPAKPGSGKAVSHISVLGGSTSTVAAGTPRVTSFSLLGGGDLYMHDVMGPGVEVTVSCTSILGGADIYVPPGVRIVDNSIGLLGGCDVEIGASGDGSNGTLVLTGFSMLGGNDVRLDPRFPQERH